MNIDINQLASTITTMLVPFLPFWEIGKSAAGKIVEGATEEIGKKLADPAFMKVKAVWERLTSGKQAQPTYLLRAAEDVITTNKDLDNIAALRKEIRKILEEDTDLANDIAKIIAEPSSQQVGTITQSITNDVGEITGIVINQNKVSR